MKSLRHLPVVRAHEAEHEQAPQHAPPVEAAPLFSPAERQGLSTLAEAIMPQGRSLPGGGSDTVGKVEEFLRSTAPALTWGYRALLHALDLDARLRYGRSLAGLAADQALRLCLSVQQGGLLRRAALRSLLTPLKIAHFQDPEVFRKVDGSYGLRQPAPAEADLPRHVRERTLSAAEVPAGETLECDVVVIGSGAGGAVAAKELAEAGHAVILLEEGRYYTRADFTGNSIEMQRKLYRDMGATVALGNTAIPVPIGRSVGGTTTVNSGTCYRAPARVFAKWRDHHGLRGLSEEELAAHYARVEEVLQVAPARPAQVGGVGRTIARGCERLGYRHAALLRNAPDCDGQGVCCFGCPTDAKRSTNVSYVPLALRAGAQLVTEARAERLLVEGGRAVGVRAGHFEVRARAVVVAAGALMTPVLLLSDPGARRALARSGQLGRNLSIHPAAGVMALLPDEAVRGYAAIPQGYAIEEWHDEGILMEGAFTPLDLTSGTVTSLGRPFMDIMEAYDRLLCFGFLIEDEGHGRVRPGPRGRPLITYDLSAHDVARLKRGVCLLSQVYLAAGAERVLPQVHGFPELRGEADLRRLRRAVVSPRDFELTAYHPLGTARMGPDPRSSVVDEDGQAHDLPGLYLCDGSVLPTSPAVNPQLTIMALATRSARRLADRL